MIEALILTVHRWHAGFRHILRQRCTRSGQVALAALVCSAVAGLDTNRNLAYQLFCLLLVLLCLAVLGLRGLRPQVAVQRNLPRLATVGEPLRYRLSLSNLARQPLEGVELDEDLPDPRPQASAYHAARRSQEGHAKRWQRLLRQAQRATSEACSVPVLGAGETLDIPMALTPLRRGRLHLPGVRLRRAELLGLLKAQKRLPVPDSLLVLPRRFRLPPLALPGNQAMLQGSQTVAASVADAEEFQSLRDYRPGDPLRLIHWKSWARSGKPVIREFQDEYSVRHALILDTFTTAATPEAVFEDAVSLAASFACTVDTRESLLDLLFVGAEVYRETTGRGHGPVEHLLEVLAGVTPCEHQPFRHLHDAVLEQAHGMSGCLCILLGWDEARAALIQQLAARGTPYALFILTDAARSTLALPAPEHAHVLTAGQMEEGLAAC